MSYQRGVESCFCYGNRQNSLLYQLFHLRRTASTFSLGFVICIQGQSGGDRKKRQTGKTWGESTAGIWAQADQWGRRAQSSSVVQTSTGAQPLFVPFWGHFIFSSKHLCIHATHTSAAVWCSGLSLLDHLASLMWCQPAAWKRHPPSKQLLKVVP